MKKIKIKPVRNIVWNIGNVAGGSVGNSVSDSVRDSVEDFVEDIDDSVYSVWDPIYNSLRKYVDEKD
uniref:Uncharacterized protein n=1 Tax=viral metagenome TaxID=1070528 RepID=A0A6H1ZZL6_9ZZZZ